MDLNADLGEAFGAWAQGDDEALMQSVSSANIACGFHAGDPSVMRRTLRLAKQYRVAVGAHPSFPDLPGFGRRAMEIPSDALVDLVLYQIAALAGLAAAEGVSLSHVKPHGALYTMAACDPRVARAIAEATRQADPSLVLFGLAGSMGLDVAREAGLRVAAEGFADRGYERDGRLRARELPGAVLADVSQVADRALQMAKKGSIETVDGALIELPVETICLHGDTPGAADLARAVRARLERHGIEIRPPS